MKIILKLFFTCTIFLFCSPKLFAQDATADSSGPRPGDLIQSEPLADTVLKRNLFENNDSLQEYKLHRDFAYMQYLDSLLRQTKGLTVDTFSVNSISSSRGKKQTQQNSQEENTTRRINIFGLPAVKIILWILAILLIGFIIYKLFLGENFFRRNRTYKNISETQKEEEEFSDPSAYDKLIAQAVLNRNYRLAIRYAYLQTLKKLANTGLLQLSVDKTNYQYVNELRGKPYQNDFAALTLNYEYVWYGRFEIGEDVYRRLSREYKLFHQKI